MPGIFVPETQQFAGAGFEMVAARFSPEPRGAGFDAMPSDFLCRREAFAKSNP